MSETVREQGRSGEILEREKEKTSTPKPCEILSRKFEKHNLQLADPAARVSGVVVEREIRSRRSGTRGDEGTRELSVEAEPTK